MDFIPRSSGSGATSMSTTLKPADAHVCAMPFPISPAPQTPTVRISDTDRSFFLMV